MSKLELSELPVVMCFSVQDPTGASGIQADIEVLNAFQCHPVTIPTSLMTRDTRLIRDIVPTPSQLLIEQARMVLEDMPVKAFKLGFLGDTENVSAIHTLLSDYPDIPVILEMSSEQQQYGEHLDRLWGAVRSLLLPHTHILVINTLHARALAEGADTVEACVHELMAGGPSFVLMTGDHERTLKVENCLLGNFRQLSTYQWERLSNDYLGGSSTLTAAIAALTAQGLSAISAVHEAQSYTQESLRAGRRVGMGSLLPNRQPGVVSTD